MFTFKLELIMFKSVKKKIIYSKLNSQFINFFLEICSLISLSRKYIFEKNHLTVY